MRKCVLAALMMLAAMTTAYADQLTYHVRSNYPFRVQIEFYSETDRSRAWPGSGRAYDLNTYARQSIRLNCWTGEKICYGAWVTGDDSRYWGAGNNNSRHCPDCCSYCGHGDVNLTLNE